MTEGSILRHIILFSIPLLLGNLFQQLYGTVDTWVVGNYVNNEVFAALGGIGQVLNLLIGLFMGLASGTEVVIARYFGAKDMDKVSRAVHTAMIMNIWLSILITLIGIRIIPFVLDLMDAPEEVRPYASAYLSIYFGGVIGLTTYNMGTGILRAVGDSYRPFCYLAVTTVLNIALDLIFVIGFRCGVAGAAWATVISQSISALLVLIRLFRTNSCIRLEPDRLKLNFAIQKQMLAIGIPTGLQTAVTAVSNIFLNSYIYYHGVDCMSGWAAYDKLINFMHLPMLSISYAITSCVSQNYGSGKMKRVQSCVRQSITLGVVISLVIMIFYETFPVGLIRIFQNKDTVVEYGVLFLRTIAPCYIFSGTAVLYSAASRGLGNSVMPMLVTVCSYVAFRQLFMIAAVHIWKNDSILFLIAAYSASWIGCTIVQRFLYRKQLIKKLEEVKGNE